ncbi:uncharacterized protein LOC134253027 [Saccostrea cucullata]|uniref:uncharacterized protein LOC134253027 n=1 Tax=Saccostrea cuccullata TaxID=36930 RepID=UPI002ED2E52B
MSESCQSQNIRWMDVLYHLLYDVHRVESKIENLEKSKRDMNKEIRTLKHRRNTVCESGVIKLYHGVHRFSWPYVKHIYFKKHFEKPPVITYGIFTLDTSHKKNTRFRTDVVYITKSKFALKLRTWNDSITYGVGLSWMACGK